MNKFAAIIIFFSFCPVAMAATAPTAQEERAQDLLREEKALRGRIEEDQKVFIEKIDVRGSSILSKQDLDEIGRIFVRQWLSQKDIASLCDSIKHLYELRKIDPPEISSYIIINILEIVVEEKNRRP